MPYVMIKKNGKRDQPGFLFTEEMVQNLHRNAAGDCFTLVNVVTREVRKVGDCAKKRKRGTGRRGKRTGLSSCGCGG